MAFTIIESSGSKLKFLVEDVDVSIVNSIRRIILAEIPNVAIAFDPTQEQNDIIIHSNTCSLHNEFLAHRISLIPLHFDANEIESFDPTKYKFVLKKKNTGTDSILITTNDFDIYDENNVKYENIVRNKIFPSDRITRDHIIITRLKPNLYDLSKGEEVDIECRASIGVGKDHARWCPVSKCTYFNTLDEELVKRTRASLDPSEYNKFDHLDKYRLFKKNKYDEPCSFEFEIESECRLSPKYLFGKAIQILKSQIEEFAGTFVDCMEFRNEMYTFTVQNCSHTMINVLQALIYNNNFRNVKDNVLEFVGYHQSHPLDKKMILKLKFKEGEANVEGFLRKQCDLITTHLDDLAAKWDKV